MNLEMKSNKTDYNLLEKQIRAEVIYEHLKKSNLKPQIICFTSGNSAKFLEAKGLKVLAYGSNQKHKPNHWFSFNEIAKKFKMFDATSGHLPMPLMNEIALKLKKILRNKFKKHQIYHIKTGSGETIICLKMAFPNINFHPMRLKDYPNTEYHKEAPLNSLVFALFKTLE